MVMRVSIWKLIFLLLLCGTAVRILTSNYVWTCTHSILRDTIPWIRDSNSSMSSSDPTLRSLWGRTATNAPSRANTLKLDHTGDGERKAERQKYLIYMCSEGSKGCSGWSDRQKGLVSVYFLSLATERRYGVIMTKPCNFTRFYVPNDVNWVVPEQELQGRSSKYIKIKASNETRKNLTTLDFNGRFPQDVVYITTSIKEWRSSILGNPRYSGKLPSWARSVSDDEAFARAWRRLMRPSEELQQWVDRYLTSINFSTRTQPLACAHVRTWIGLNETTRHTERVKVQNSHLYRVWAFLQQYVQTGSRVFVATDSYDVRNEARRRFGDRMFDTGGTILHVERDHKRDDACEGFKFAVLDQLLLTYCDVLLVSSGFSQRAAIIRGKPDNVYLYENGLIKQYNNTRMWFE